MKILSLLPALVVVLSACATVPAGRQLSSESPVWQSRGDIETAMVEGSLQIVRADPRLAALELVNPPESASLSIAQLAAQRNFSVAVNAAMFAKDYVTSIGYMKHFDRLNNSRVSKNLHGFLLFNPKIPKLAAVKIGTKEDIGAYNSVIQTHRMIDSNGKILWNKGSSVYFQVALVGVDDKERVLFFYHPSLTDVHDMVERILSLDLHLKGLLYLDGGNHGSLYFAPDVGRGWNTWMQLPNVLGLKSSSQ
jgi:hypothetical protein